MLNGYLAHDKKVTLPRSTMSLGIVPMQGPRGWRLLMKRYPCTPKLGWKGDDCPYETMTKLLTSSGFVGLFSRSFFAEGRGVAHVGRNQNLKDP